MTVLADAVHDAQPTWTDSELSRRTGLSTRTVRELLRPWTGQVRQFRRYTLAKLDGPLGWEPGVAWRLYTGQPLHPDWVKGIDTDIVETTGGREMKILVGWWNPKTTELVDIPGFDLVHDTAGWLPAVVDVPPHLAHTLRMGLSQR
jgi:hypothetical protein